MSTPVPSRSASPVTIAIVAIASAVAGSLAVWTALAPGAQPSSTKHTCQCECLTPSLAEPETLAAEPSAAKRPVGRLGRDRPNPRRSIDPSPEPPASPQPRVRQAKAEVVGPLDRDIIRRIVRAHINEVRHCYNQGLATDPELAGRVAIQFKIGSAGKVLEATVASSTLSDHDDAVAACVNGAVKRWKFPKFEGEEVTVTYPFVLSPGD